jgi:hypothetical protein
MLLLLNPNDWDIIVATVHRENGFEFRIWPNDHSPPHVHAWKAGGMAKIELVDGFDIVKVREMKPVDVVRAVRIVIANEEKLIHAWGEIHVQRKASTN